jgi:tetratricopeptide (TPR) repeat protein
LHARENRRPEAVKELDRAAKVDPPSAFMRPAFTRFFLSHGDTLVGVEGLAARIAQGDRDILSRMLEALSRYYERDLSGTDRALKRALHVMELNALANSYEALLLLDQGAPQKALKSAERAVAQDRQLAVAHFALGLSLARTGKGERGQRELTEVHKLSPILFAAEVELAQLEGKRDKAAARERLMHILALEPGYAPAKRALYMLEQEG